MFLLPYFHFSEFDGADFFSTPSDFHGHQDDDDGDDDMTFGGGHGGSFPPHGGDFFFRFEEDTRNIFGHFEEMFKNFGHNEFLPSGKLLLSNRIPLLACCS